MFDAGLAGAAGGACGVAAGVGGAWVYCGGGVAFGAAAGSAYKFKMSVLIKCLLTGLIYNI